VFLSWAVPVVGCPLYEVGHGEQCQLDCLLKKNHLAFGSTFLTHSAHFSTVLVWCIVLLYDVQYL